MNNKHADGYDRYPIVHGSKLPDDVRDEVCNDCPSNDCGVIVNPKYRPKFKAWLEAEEMDNQCYIVWFSW